MSFSLGGGGVEMSFGRPLCHCKFRFKPSNRGLVFRKALVSQVESISSTALKGFFWGDKSPLGCCNL